MPKIIKGGKYPTVQFSKAEIEKVKRIFYAEVDEFLSERYAVTLPLYALKLLVEYCVKDKLNDDCMLEHGLAISNREGIVMQTKINIPLIIAEELSKHGVDGDKFVNDIFDKVKEDFDESIKRGEETATNK